jgi:hypothetical protein
MTAFRLKNMRHRSIAVATTVAMAAACTIVSTAPSASARTADAAKPAAKTTAASTSQSAQLAKPELMKPEDIASGTSLCLSNSDQWCLGINIPVQDIIADSEGLAAILVAIWAVLRVGNKPTPPDQNDPEDEVVVEGEEGGGDDGEGLCLADTGGDAYLASCGANGTVWIVIPHNDGYYLESRYLYNNGHPNQVLTIDPLSQDSPIYCHTAENPGSPYWQTFSSVYQLLGPKQ